MDILNALLNPSYEKTDGLVLISGLSKKLDPETQTDLSKDVPIATINNLDQETKIYRLLISALTRTQNFQEMLKYEAERARIVNAKLGFSIIKHNIIKAGMQYWYGSEQGSATDFEAYYKQLQNVKNRFHVSGLLTAKDFEDGYEIPPEIKSSNPLETRKELGDDVAILAYSYTNEDKIVQILIGNNVVAREVSFDEVLGAVAEQYDADIQNCLNNLGSTGVPPAQPQRTILPRETPRLKNTGGRLGKWLSCYHYFLDNPSPENKPVTDELARHLYEFLLKPMIDSIPNGSIRKLIIIPDGLLSVIPFESLIDGQGKYLVETYDVGYNFSLNTLSFLKLRNYEYLRHRKPVLAFGGAFYEERNGPAIVASPVTVHNPDAPDPAHAREKYALLMEKKRKGIWSNLPGSLREVENISTIVPGTELITGKQVSEERVKTLSQNGELEKYRVLHFAVHGFEDLADAESPTLVLSQHKPQKEGDDGLLKMSEIASLKLAADFVNLSACVTGLGKANEEGVAGLARSFLIAGANAVSSSLWYVSDESTALFMTGVYRLVNNNGMSYFAAINEMKRAFIREQSLGGADVKRTIGVSPNTGAAGPYSHPHYWAAFAYYGLPLDLKDVRHPPASK